MKYKYFSVWIERIADEKWNYVLFQNWIRRNYLQSKYHSGCSRIYMTSLSMFHNSLVYWHTPQECSNESNWFFMPVLTLNVHKATILGLSKIDIYMSWNNIKYVSFSTLKLILIFGHEFSLWRKLTRSYFEWLSMESVW